MYEVNEMKKLLYILMCLFVVVGCSSKNNVIDLKNDNVSMWDKSTLVEGQLKEADLRVKMSIEEMSEELIKVKLWNQTCWDCGYAQSFDIQVFLDNVWYDVPVVDTYVEKPAYGMIVEGYSIQTKEYHVLEKYGVLPEGNYRIVVEGHTCEFKVK